ncbi:MAG: CoA pyrophosphatase [Alphaproteobacteria bacterium]|nr:CoA pyrophosphatase [Alphaproteobacteria bacterium]
MLNRASVRERLATPRLPRERGDGDLNPEFRRRELLAQGRSLRPAAVLVPLVDRAHGMTVLLTQRSPHLADHAGQVCFPGGRIEPHDPDPATAALREAQEEVGLAPDCIELIGQLDKYVVRTGYEITPVVGVLDPPSALVHDPTEVSEVFEVPLSFILDPANVQLQQRAFNGAMRQFYVWPYPGYYIWGATAAMLVNLSEVLRR